MSGEMEEHIHLLKGKVLVVREYAEDAVTRSQQVRKDTRELIGNRLEVLRLQRRVAEKCGLQRALLARIVGLAIRQHSEELRQKSFALRKKADTCRIANRQRLRKLQQARQTLRETGT